ncbi:28S ribosomal protein S29, mitochondrial [Caerostris extrusa]|uniref:Small ribosomal subunit protein mS29 n=1 Tax=Caerostris extrusa TaxID=172846 RepID=A0AAV4P5L3_CAEEX|nr:28S ribosomal protein S29, mitochondrial [Caerostris extrusa]
MWTKRPKEVEPSQFKEGRIDLPVESAIWLQHFKMQNSELLQELDLKTSKSYTWSKREVTEQGASLMDIVEHVRFKIMVLVDGVNAFWNKTNVKRPDKTLVPPQEITITRAFLKLLQNDWNNSVILTSVDVIPFNRNAKMNDPYTPRALLGKEGFECMDPFIPIQIENYTDKEMHSVLEYYIDRLWIQSEQGRSEEGRDQIKFLSGSNPLQVMKLCEPL